MIAALVIVPVVLNIILALIVLQKNPKSNINISFAFFVVSSVLWIIVNTLSNIVPDDSSAFFLNKLIFIFSAYAIYGLLCFSIFFPNNRWSVKTWHAVFLSIPVFLSNFLVISNITIKGVTFLEGGGTGVVFGLGIYFYALQLIVYLSIAIGILIYKFFKLKGYHKAQIQYLIFGSVLFLVSAVITNLIFPLLYNNFLLSNLGPFFSVATFGFTSYAILKKRLLDIKLIIARTVAYTLVVIILGAFYGFGVFLIGNVLFGRISDSYQLAVSITLALIMALSFQTLRRLVEKVTDRIFFKDLYSSQAVLKSLTEIMATSLELNTLTEGVITTLISDMKITKGGFLLLSDSSPDKPGYSIFKGFDEIPKMMQETILEFMNDKAIINFDEIPEGRVKDLMRSFKLSVVLNLTTTGKKVGILCLGEKLSGEIYSEQDMSVFEILAPELAIAVNNSQEFEEIKKFNVTLKDEVERATRELKSANEQLKQLDKLKDEFVSLASHELRTPLTAIKSYLWMALDGKAGELNEKQKMYLDRSYKSADRLGNLVNDMLDVSRIESGRVTLEKKPVKLNELANDVVQEVSARAQEVNVSITLDAQSNLPEIMVDPDKIKQVLFNLLGNSLKFTPQGGKIAITISERNGMCELKVSDTGKGIAKENLGKLFQKFGIIEGTYTNSDSKGTGLGLYLSKSIIELHGGTISADSEGVGHGTTFTVNLPIAKPLN